MLKPQMIRPQPQSRRSSTVLFAALALILAGAAIGVTVDHSIKSTREPAGFASVTGGGTAPIVFRCGESPTVRGTDEAFMVTTGDGARGCDVLFVEWHDKAPNCYVSSLDGGALAVSHTSTPIAMRMDSVLPNRTYGVYCPKESARSAGVNSLVNYGTYANASGSQENYGLWSGSTTISDSLTDAHTYGIGGTLTIGNTATGDVHMFYPDAFDTVTISGYGTANAGARFSR